MNNYKNQLFAILYGDCYVDSNHNSNKSRLDIYHTEKNLDFILKKKEILESIGVTCNLKEKIDTRPLKNGQTRKGYRLQTNFSDILYSLHSTPFEQVSKHLVTPEGLAILWQDDGTVCWHNARKFSTATLATDDWEKWKLDSLREEWYNVYGWCPKEQDYKCRGKHYLRLRLVKNQVEKLSNLIHPFVVESMRYKLIIRLD